MPATVTATAMGKNSSAVRATLACTAGATSLDVLTVNHGLGQCPQKISTHLRSIVVSASAAGVGLCLQSWDMTRALFILPLGVGGGAVSASFDIVFERAHSLVR